MPKSYIFGEADLMNMSPVSPEELKTMETPPVNERHEGISLSLAREIMEKSHPGLFFGPEEIKRVFNIDISEVPPIPFTTEDLEQAEKLEQQLVLYVNTAPDGTALTIAKMNSLMQGKTSDGGKLLYNSNGPNFKTDAWYLNEDFANKQTPNLCWRLSGKTELTDPTDPSLESKSKNYLEQTVVTIKYLKEKVFINSVIPDKLQEAIQEFETEMADIATLIDSDWQKAGDMLEDLKITGLIRELPVEVIYRLILTDRGAGEKLLPVNYTWTRGRSSGGGFVNVGGADAGGADVLRWRPDDRGGLLGASLSRSA